MENRYAVIDIGSNTVRMVFYDRLEGGVERVIGEKASLGLINFIEGAVMSEAGVQKLLLTLEGFCATARKLNCGNILAFATASLRGLLNSKEVVKTALDCTGIAIDVLSGEDEARLNFEIVKNEFELTDGLMIDMGGGSTEVVSFCEGEYDRSVSLGFGCLRLYNQFVGRILPTRQESEAIKAHVRGQLEDHGWINAGRAPVAYTIGGTVNAASKVYAAVYGVKRPKSLEVRELTELCEHLVGDEERAALLLVKETPDRLHTLIPGIFGLSELLAATGAKRVVITTCGLREGYLLRYLDSVPQRA